MIDNPLPDQVMQVEWIEFMQHGIYLSIRRSITSKDHAVVNVS